jgi:hypothetical protein
LILGDVAFQKALNNRPASTTLAIVAFQKAPRQRGLSDSVSAMGPFQRVGA